VEVASNVLDDTWIGTEQLVAGDGTPKKLYHLTAGQDLDILRVGKQ
jgi:hypothetical protein